MYWNFGDILISPLAPKFNGLERPLIVEIGFGNGEFLEHLARTRPEASVVGIEVSQWCVTKAVRRALAADLPNVRVLPGDARYLLKLAFEPHCISEVYMNFPCPWPKRRHSGRRVARPAFAALISSALRPGGAFTLATDVDWYADETREVFSASPDFETGEVQKNPVREYRTKYERKWSEMGRDTYTVVARKIEERDTVSEHAAEAAEAAEIEATMPESDFRAALAAVKGDTVNDRGYKIIFRDIFFADDDTALVLVIAVDEGFEQHYYLRLIPSGDGRIRGKVDSVGHPYRTPGVRASIRHLMQKIGARF